MQEYLFKLKSKIKRIDLFKILSFCIILFTIHNYFHSVKIYSVNFPLADDYDSILNFLNLWEETDSKLTLLFSQHNEHRIVFLRVISLIHFKISNVINLKNLIMFGNSLLLVFLFILYKSTSDKRKFILFTPILFLILNSSHWENQTWATTTLANYPVLVFAFLSLYFISKNGFFYFFLGISFAILSTFSLGNGFFVFICGTILLSTHKPKLIIWVFTGGFIILLYFFLFPYHNVNHHQTILFKLDLIFLVNRIFYAFALLSAPFQSKLVLVLGTIPFLMILYIFKNHFRFTKLHLSMLAFIILSFISITISRDQFGYEQAFSSRYQFNAIVLYSILYLCFLNKIKLKKHFFVILVLSGLFFINANFSNIQNLYTRKAQILLDKNCLDKCEHYNTYPNDNFPKKVLSTSLQKGITQPERK